MITKFEKKLWILIGIAGVGKTTYYQKNLKDCIHLCGDTIRFMLYNYEETDRDFWLNASSKEVNEMKLETNNFRNFEYVINDSIRYMFEKLIKENVNICIDDINLKVKNRYWYIYRALCLNYEVNLVLFTNNNKAYIQNHGRKRIVPKNELDKMVIEFEDVSEWEKDNCKNIIYIN